MIGLPGKLSASAKPKGPSSAKIKQAEDAFQRLINGGKVKDLNKAREAIRKKYGINPNGRTN